MDSRENYLRTVRFERPEWIPMVFYISPACWGHYEQSALEDLVASFPRLFDGADPAKRPNPGEAPPWQQTGQPFSDPWGCVWNTRVEGMTGAVVQHPLADWNAWATYRAPDPTRTDGMLPVDWTVVAETFRRAAAQERLREGGLRHGHTFQRLSYLRGYENLIFDMADREPRLSSLIEMLEGFNAEIVGGYLEARAEVVSFPEDLGMQRGPMLSPQYFCRYIKPSYQRLMGPVRRAGAVVHVHSDGDLRALADDLLECPLDVLNLQDLVNGLDWIGLDPCAAQRPGMHRSRYRPPEHNPLLNPRRNRPPHPPGSLHLGKSRGRADDDLWALPGCAAGERSRAGSGNGPLRNVFFINTVGRKTLGHDRQVGNSRPLVSGAKNKTTTPARYNRPIRQT